MEDRSATLALARAQWADANYLECARTFNSLLEREAAESTAEQKLKLENNIAFCLSRTDLFRYCGTLEDEGEKGLPAAQSSSSSANQAEAPSLILLKTEPWRAQNWTLNSLKRCLVERHLRWPFARVILWDPLGLASCSEIRLMSTFHWNCEWIDGPFLEGEQWCRQCYLLPVGQFFFLDLPPTGTGVEWWTASPFLSMDHHQERGNRVSVAEVLNALRQRAWPSSVRPVNWIRQPPITTLLGSHPAECSRRYRETGEFQKSIREFTHALRLTYPPDFPLAGGDQDVVDSDASRVSHIGRNAYLPHVLISVHLPPDLFRPEVLFRLLDILSADPDLLRHVLLMYDEEPEPYLLHEITARFWWADVIQFPGHETFVRQVHHQEWEFHIHVCRHHENPTDRRKNPKDDDPTTNCSTSPLSEIPLAQLMRTLCEHPPCAIVRTVFDRPPVSVSVAHEGKLRAGNLVPCWSDTNIDSNLLSSKGLTISSFQPVIASSPPPPPPSSSSNSTD